jgi:hypothetical protein
LKELPEAPERSKTFDRADRPEKLDAPERSVEPRKFSKKHP